VRWRACTSTIAHCIPQTATIMKSAFMVQRDARQELGLRNVSMRRCTCAIERSIRTCNDFFASASCIARAAASNPCNEAFPGARAC
jgi:hypothetical protein